MALRIPLAAFFGDNLEPNTSTSTDYPRLLRDADIIFGIDVMSEAKFLVFGDKLLKKITRSGQGKACAVLEIEIDGETDELEKLIALVKVTRGSHCYKR